MLLSFDGGGSKTAVQLCDLQGRVLAEETIDTIDYGQIGIPQVAARLKAGLNAVLRRSGKEEKALAGITVGLPRLGEIPAESRDLEQAVREVFPATARVFPVNDVVCAMYGALGGRPGICLLCGTGSMAMGMDEQGDGAIFLATKAPAIGWGYRPWPCLPRRRTAWRKRGRFIPWYWIALERRNPWRWWPSLKSWLPAGRRPPPYSGCCCKPPRRGTGRPKGYMKRPPRN